jgi:hypothetical protein
LRPTVGINRHDVPTMMAVILLIVVFAVAAGTLPLAADRRLHRTSLSLP